MVLPAAPTAAAAAVEVDGARELSSAFVQCTALWLVLFYALSYTEPLWARLLPSSGAAMRVTAHNRYVSARNVLGIVHALLVAGVAMRILFAIPHSMWFESSPHLATCAHPDEPEKDAMGKAMGAAGLAFTAFTAADIVISLVHGPVTFDYMVHHIVFLTAGLIIRGHCMLPFNASILLAMESSTPFLNFAVFVWHRGAKRLAKVAGAIFVVLFTVFRLILNTYGVALLWSHRGAAIPLTVPWWQQWLLYAVVSMGAAVQFIWFPSIAMMCGAGMAAEMGAMDWQQLRDALRELQRAMASGDSEEAEQHPEQQSVLAPCRRKPPVSPPLYAIDECRRVAYAPVAIGFFDHVIQRTWVSEPALDGLSDGLAATHPPAVGVAEGAPGRAVRPRRCQGFSNCQT